MDAIKLFYIGILYEIRKKTTEGKIKPPDMFTSSGMLNGEDWDGLYQID